MRVLGVETSCDETGIAIYDSALGLRAHRLFSQVQMHQEYGGVVPELASRDHVTKIIPLVKQVLADAKLSRLEIDAVAYTAGPGLVGALLVGAAFARSFAYALDKPAIGVHHLEGHLLAPMLEPNPPAPPFVALLVSGGHSMLIEVQAIGVYKLLGDTLDDAAGEAFDKTAQLLGLGYPGGPALAELATRGSGTRFRFSRPMTDRPGLDFSFSGLKTQVMLAARKAEPLDQATRAELARSFEDAITDTLTVKCARAMQATGAKTLVVAGGVGANLRLRAQLMAAGEREAWRVAFPRSEFCTDNGAMIAYAGALRLNAGQCDPLAIQASPRWDLTSLTSLDRR